VKAKHKNDAVRQAYEDLHLAIETRDLALGRAAENVYTQFASIVAKREKAYNDALRRSRQEAGDAMDD
jgi:hypothetical protein